MSALVIYAVIVTAVALAAIAGWLETRDVLVMLANVSNEDWPHVRGILRQKFIRRGKP